ncbi:serine/threonine-protein kinase [Geodermatophilus obscurus]|uniref:non-specific serine/threonine protein kinase n=1 Tax=Geodermatophilus obscurus (strain ATCC 25078 / DSM 43160 / JCM 3152 / CCUG 61914 / KCC A-0152 / KCTC 9177 / NBRC 13315 / NRRL B-3577 / G-20) TaxID=526225 RepID=D2SCD2_GEOOG|nr:serine/threonine-protein kinase [Geodermatophilus obscurus]ADB76260.1 serine/threonine protein kinase [Geodermatophilus obscurus DSM 43160]
MAAAGDVLQDRYELRSLIATGGMGEVWRAQDRVLGREVAAKVLKSEFTGDPVFLTRFRTEARLSAGLTHPNVAVLHDYGEVEPASPGGDRLVYLVMELVDGEPLSAVLRREGRLTPERTLELLGQVAAGLGAAHAAGIVHRDVKPANLLVRSDGTVKITDFGIAWSAANATVTRTGHVVGTAQYLAPELVQGQKATPAVDVYAWGTVAYECLAGRRPFDGPDPVEVAMRRVSETPAPLPADVPAPVRELVERTLATDPATRIPDGAALVAAVADAAAGRAPEPADERTATRVLPVVPAPQPATATLPVSPVAAAAVAPVVPGLDDEEAEEADDRGPVRRLVVPVLVGLVATALVVTGLVLGSRDVPAPAAPAAAPATTAPVTSAAPRVTGTFVRVDPAAHVGSSVAEVHAWLTGLDLTVALVAVERADVPAGQVLALAPTGEVPVGTTVTVTHAVPPPPPPPPAPAPTAAPTAGSGSDDGDRGKDKEKDGDRGRGRDKHDD